MRISRSSLLVLFSFFCLSLVFATAVHAQDARLITLPTGSFACANGASNMLPITTEPSRGALMGIISTFQQSLMRVMATMYCAVSRDIEPILSALAVLAVIIFALSFLAGLTRFSAGEAVKIIIKIALIWMCAINLDTAMNVTYTFFLGAVKDGTEIAFGSGDSASFGARTANAIESGAGGTNASCTEGYGTIFAFSLIFLPFLIIPLILFLFTFGMLFIRIIGSYMVSLTVMAMLMGLAPFFVAFAMFSKTKQVFDSWLDNMVSYAMQGFIVMAFIFFISSIDFLGPIKDLADHMYKTFIGFKFGQFQVGYYTCTPCVGFDFDTSTGAITCDKNEGVSIFEMLTQGKLFAYVLIHFVGLIILMKLLQAAVDYIPAVAQTLGKSGLAIAFAADPGGSSKGIRGGAAAALPGLDIQQVQLSTGVTKTIGNKANNFMTGVRWAADPFFHRREKNMIRKQADANYYKTTLRTSVANDLQTIKDTAEYGWGLARFKKDAWKRFGRGLVGIENPQDNSNPRRQGGIFATIREGRRFASFQGNAEQDIFNITQNYMFNSKEERAAAKSLVQAQGHFDIMQQYYRTTAKMYGYGKVDDLDLSKSYYEFTNAEKDQIARDMEYYQTQGKQALEALQSTQKSSWQEENEKNQNFWMSMMGY